MITQTGTDLTFASELLRKGELVAIPTETVYGLAANALNADAVLKIYETKGRPTFNPLIVHVHDEKQFEKYSKNIPGIVYTLAEKFSPGPLTFVLPKKDVVPDIVTGGGETVALRVPGHPMTLKLLSQLEFPLASPSANPFGYISPVNAMHVKDQLDGKIPYIIDGGNSMIGVESTVISFSEKTIHILRAGGVSKEDIAEAILNSEFQIRSDEGKSLKSSSSGLQSPGMLKSHYAPRIKLYHGEIARLVQEHAGKKIALLTFSESFSETANVVAREVLSSKRDLHEAARNLFTAMRKLDASDAEIILAEKFPDFGLGVAINDRLERAGA